MVLINKKQRANPTMEEANFLIDASTRIAWYGEQVFCPRCGKPLVFEKVNTSYSVECSDENCISITCRGI